MNQSESILNQIISYITNAQNFINNDFTLSNTILLSVLLFFLLINLKQTFSIISLKKRIKSIPSLNITEKVLADISKLTNKLYNFEINQETHKIEINNLKNTQKTIPEINLIRYNPYKDMGVGGNQSFSMSILDKNGNGVILTSLYSREKSRILIKKVENHQPQQELTLEEKDLLSLITNKEKK